MSFMSQGFSEQSTFKAPDATVDNMNDDRLKKIDLHLEGKPLRLKEMADDLYEKAMVIARRIDGDTANEKATAAELNLFPLNENAIRAAQYVAHSCTRILQNS